MKFLRFILASSCRRTQSRMLKNFSQFSKQKYNSRYLIIPSVYTSYSGVVNINLDEQSEEEEEVMKDVPAPRNSIQEACTNSLQAITDLLNRIFEGVSDSALQYKASLNELYSFLEKYQQLKEYPHACAEIEDSIVATRAKVLDREQRYLQLVAVMQSVEKLVKATCELSFIIQEEGLVMVLTQTLNSIRESIDLNSKEIASVKRKFCKFEESTIINTDVDEQISLLEDQLTNSEEDPS